MAKYQVLYWHDIPIQVKSRDRSGRASKQLPPRFQEAIDNAAMAAGLIGDDAYTDGFHWQAKQDHPGTAQAVVDAIITELDAQYPSIDWRATAKKLKENAERRMKNAE